MLVNNSFELTTTYICCCCCCPDYAFETMSESVYVIRLYQGGKQEIRPGPSRQSEDRSSPPSQLPSEQRYSARLVLGLGIVHICLGLLSAGFAVMAVFLEPEINKYASGLWAGIVYMACGIFGILAHSR